MKKIAASLALIALTACQETPTSSERVSTPGIDGRNSSFHWSPSEPPPPPTDTGAVAFTGGGSYSFNATYLLNPTNTNGFLTFKSEQPDGTVASPSARVQYQKGTFSGRGTLSFASGDGMIVVDLASVSSSSSFTSCAKGCFNVRFDDVSFRSGGVSRPIEGGAQFRTSRAVVDEGTVPVIVK